MMLLRLFWEFFKIGLFAVGGGMATIPFLYDLSDRTGWFTHTQLADMIAISESTPGPIGVNMATYVGYEMSGIPGSIFTTLGFVAPSIIIIIIVSLFLQRFRENRYVESAFYGLRPASSGLIASALGALLYPDYCEYDLQAEVTEYYELFYQCELTQEMYDNLMVGAMPE